MRHLFAIGLSVLVLPSMAGATPFADDQDDHARLVIVSTAGQPVVYGIDPIVTGPTVLGAPAGRIFTRADINACDADCQAKRLGLNFE